MKIFKQNKGITLVALIITIIILLILAGVSISMIIGENGILTKAQKAKELAELSSEEELINLIVINSHLTNEKIGQKLDEIKFNTVDDTTSIYDSETGKSYGSGWYYLKPDDVNEYTLKHSYIIDYDTGEFVRYDENKHRIVTNELLCITDGLVYSADPKNITNSDNWGDAILHNFVEGEADSGWSENALMFDGIDDGIEIKDNSDYSQGITLEIYLKLKGKSTSDLAQILMMKRTQNTNGFFIYLGGGVIIDSKSNDGEYGRITIDIGGNLGRFVTDTIVQENEPTYITYTYNPNAESDNGILYINGVKKQTTDLGNIDNLINTPPDTPIQIGSDIYQTYVGDDEDPFKGSNRKYPFYGEIYASRVYNRALTEKEVEYNYNMTVNNYSAVDINH